MAKKRRFFGDLEETLNSLSEAQLMGIFGGVNLDTLTDEQKAEMLQQYGEGITTTTTTNPIKKN